MKIASFALCLSLILMGAEDVDNGDFGSQGRFTWDVPTVNSDGSLLTDLAGYMISAYRATEDPRKNPGALPVWSVKIPNPAATTFDLLPVVVALKSAGAAEGSKWLFMIKAVDTGGNESAWSNSWSGTLNALPPGAPGNFGCVTTK